MVGYNGKRLRANKALARLRVDAQRFPIYVA
jgi:hypothetical protein